MAKKPMKDSSDDSMAELTVAMPKGMDDDGILVEEPPVQEAVVEEVAPPVPAPSEKKPPMRWRVKRESQVQINGCLTHLMAGQVVDAQHYGHDTLARLRAQGIEMEEIA